jgi:FAD/FMN-containing dehydrogenase
VLRYGANSYRTLAGLRLVLADGTVLDTRDAASRADFATRRPDLAESLAELGRETRADETLASRIRHKFRLKNTTGYSLNALIEFSDPVDILAHLMISSEGTLGFISEITYLTVKEARPQGERADPVRSPRDDVQRRDALEDAGRRGRAARPGIPALGAGQARHAGLRPAVVRGCLRAADRIARCDPGLAA